MLLRRGILTRLTSARGQRQRSSMLQRSHVISAALRDFLTADTGYGKHAVALRGTLKSITTAMTAIVTVPMT